MEAKASKYVKCNNKKQITYLHSFHITDPEQENLISEDVELPPHRKRGGKCK